MPMRGTAEERSASVIPDGIAECTSGYLTKQGGKYKSWRKRYFVLTGLKLRWYEKKEAFDAHGLHAARGEITCFARASILGTSSPHTHRIPADSRLMGSPSVCRRLCTTLEL